VADAGTAVVSRFARDFPLPAQRSESRTGPKHRIVAETAAAGKRSVSWTSPVAEDLTPQGRRRFILHQMQLRLWQGARARTGFAPGCGLTFGRRDAGNLVDEVLFDVLA